ncbi:hypothetical protein Tco_1485854 [Tanacetum coccineum]
MIKASVINSIINIVARKHAINFISMTLEEQLYVALKRTVVIKNYNFTELWLGLCLFYEEALISLASSMHENVCEAVFWNSLLNSSVLAFISFHQQTVLPVCWWEERTVYTPSLPLVTVFEVPFESTSRPPLSIYSRQCSIPSAHEHSVLIVGKDPSKDASS